MDRQARQRKSPQRPQVGQAARLLERDARALELAQPAQGAQRRQVGHVGRGEGTLRDNAVHDVESYLPVEAGQNTDDAVAEPEHEEWVMQEWKRFEGVNP